MPKDGPPTPSDIHLELCLDPSDLPLLIKHAAAGRRGRAVPLRMLWHDTSHGALAAHGLALTEHTAARATIWRLDRIERANGDFWIPGGAKACIAASADQAAVVGHIPNGAAEALIAIAAFEGEVRTLPPHDAVNLAVLSGELRTAVARSAVCRLALSGAAPRVTDVALALADQLRVSVPPASVAAEAYAAARIALPPKHVGAPILSRELSAEHAFEHIVAHLLDVILHYAPRAARRDGPEPVHQMRVALRRLRSAFSLFKPAVHSEAVATAQTELKAFGHVLGPARDWDVFLAGTCDEVVALFPGEAPIRRLAQKARRRRDTAYVALSNYLAGPAFRHLAIRLVVLATTRPWRMSSPPAMSESGPSLPDDPTGNLGPSGMADDGALTAVDLADFAAHALRKRFRRLVSVGDDISGFPADVLHAIRLDGKRLRYAAEFFAPLFPRRETRRFIKRMMVLQERLGILNDGAVASGLLKDIGQLQTHAGGLVRGYVAAGGTDSRDRIARSWKRFRRQEPFWD
jgi:CHAD domain-containing protein